MDRRKRDRQTGQSLDQYVLDMRDVVQAVWRRRYLALAIAAVPTIFGAAYLAVKPDMYESRATVLLEENKLNVADMEEAFPGMRFDDRTIDTEANILRSPGLIREVVRANDIKLDEDGKLTFPELDADETSVQGAGPDPVEEQAILRTYAGGLNVAPVRSSRVINISFVSYDAQVSAAIASAHARQYLASQIAQKRSQAEQLNSWIAEQVESLKTEGAKKSRVVQEFRRENGIIKGRNDGDLIYEQVSDLAAQLVPVQARKAELQSQDDAIKAAGGKVTMSAIQNSSVIQSLKTQASQARQELRAVSGKYGANHPSYIEAQRRVSQIEGDIARETAAIKTTVASELETVSAQEKILQDRLEALKGEADTQRQKQIELEGLELEAMASTRLLDGFIKRYEEISSQLDYTRPDVRILSDAEIAIFPLDQKKPMKLVVIAFVSMLFACAIVYLMSLRDQGVRTAEDVRKGLKLRLLGVLPRVQSPVLEMTPGKRSAYQEEIKRIYLQVSGKAGFKTILLTSALAGSEKAQMALALGGYLAGVGRRTILIDTDLSSGHVATLSGVEAKPGLVDVLSGNAAADAAIRTDQRGLDILPAGAGAGSASVDLLSGDAFKSLLETLKTRYDYILVDGAPVLESTDSQSVAAMADMSVMVVTAGETLYKDARRSADILRPFVREIPYVILNKADLKEAA